MYVRQASKGEHSPGNRQMCVRTTWVHTQKHLKYDMCILVSTVYVCIQRGSKCEYSQGHRRIRVAQFTLIYKGIYDIMNVYL